MHVSSASSHASCCEEAKLSQTWLPLRTHDTTMRTSAFWRIWGEVFKNLGCLCPLCLWSKLDYFTCEDHCLSFRIFFSIQWISIQGLFPFSFLNPFPPSLQITRSVSRGRESIGCIEGVELKGGTGECPCQPGKLQLHRSFVLAYDPDWKQSDHIGPFNHFSVARDHSPIFTKSSVTEH